jgi:GNAT superfamily N-acetyltransferase
MKISYLNESPEAFQFDLFIHDYTLEMNNSDMHQQIKAAHACSDYVISAYDGQKLVALGFLSSTKQYSQMETCRIYVLPSYQLRGVGSNVQKLLVAEQRFSPLPIAH